MIRFVSRMMNINHCGHSASKGYIELWKDEMCLSKKRVELCSCDSGQWSLKSYRIMMLMDAGILVSVDKVPEVFEELQSPEGLTPQEAVKWFADL